MFVLTHATGLEWAARAIDSLDRVLLDHAHCEMKAASMAMSLAARFYHHPSCERFQLLSDGLAERSLHRESSLYRDLMKSEARHYTVLRELAIEAGPSEALVLERLDELAQIEGRIAASLGEGAAIHG